MSQVIETICDQCGARKGQTNHWWSIWPSKVGFHVHPGTYDKDNSSFPEIKDYPAKDMCSESCVVRALGDYFENERKQCG